MTSKSELLAPSRYPSLSYHDRELAWALGEWSAASTSQKVNWDEILEKVCFELQKLIVTQRRRADFRWQHLVSFEKRVEFSKLRWEVHQFQCRQLGRTGGSGQQQQQQRRQHNKVKASATERWRDCSDATYRLLFRHAKSFDGEVGGYRKHAKRYLPISRKRKNITDDLDDKQILIKVLLAGVEVGKHVAISTQHGITVQDPRPQINYHDLGDDKQLSLFECDEIASTGEASPIEVTPSRTSKGQSHQQGEGPLLRWQPFKYGNPTGISFELQELAFLLEQGHTFEFVHKHCSVALRDHIRSKSHLNSFHSNHSKKVRSLAGEGPKRRMFEEYRESLKKTIFKEGVEGESSNSSKGQSKNLPEGSQSPNLAVGHEDMRCTDVANNEVSAESKVSILPVDDENLVAVGAVLADGVNLPFGISEMEDAADAALVLLPERRRLAVVDTPESDHRRTAVGSVIGNGASSLSKVSVAEEEKLSKGATFVVNGDTVSFGVAESGETSAESKSSSMSCSEKPIVVDLLPVTGDAPSGEAGLTSEASTTTKASSESKSEERVANIDFLSSSGDKEEVESIVLGEASVDHKTVLSEVEEHESLAEKTQRIVRATSDATRETDYGEPNSPSTSVHADRMDIDAVTPLNHSAAPKSIFASHDETLADPRGKKRISQVSSPKINLVRYPIQERLSPVEHAGNFEENEQPSVADIVAAFQKQVAERAQIQERAKDEVARPSTPLNSQKESASGTKVAKRGKNRTPNGKKATEQRREIIELSDSPIAEVTPVQSVVYQGGPPVSRVDILDGTHASDLTIQEHEDLVGQRSCTSYVSTIRSYQLFSSSMRREAFLLLHISQWHSWHLALHSSGSVFAKTQESVVNAFRDDELMLSRQVHSRAMGHLPHHDESLRDMAKTYQYIREKTWSWWCGLVLGCCGEFATQYPRIWNDFEYTQRSLWEYFNQLELSMRDYHFEECQKRPSQRSTPDMTPLLQQPAIRQNAVDSGQYAQRYISNLNNYLSSSSSKRNNDFLTSYGDAWKAWIENRNPSMSLASFLEREEMRLESFMSDEIAMVNQNFRTPYLRSFDTRYGRPLLAREIELYLTLREKLWHLFCRNILWESWKVSLSLESVVTVDEFMQSQGALWEYFSLMERAILKVHGSRCSELALSQWSTLPAPRHPAPPIPNTFFVGGPNIASRERL